MEPEGARPSATIGRIREKKMLHNVEDSVSHYSSQSFIKGSIILVLRSIANTVVRC